MYGLCGLVSKEGLLYDGKVNTGLMVKEKKKQWCYTVQSSNLNGPFLNLNISVIRNSLLYSIHSETQKSFIFYLDARDSCACRSVMNFNLRVIVCVRGCQFQFGVVSRTMKHWFYYY